MPPRAQVGALTVVIVLLVTGGLGVVRHRRPDPTSAATIGAGAAAGTNRAPTTTSSPSSSTSASTSNPATSRPAPTNVAPPARSGAAGPGSPGSLAGSILFVSRRQTPPPASTAGPVTPSSNGSNLWAMSPDGTNQRPLTRSGHDAAPALSPGGERVAWVVARSEVWTMNADGSAARRLASCPLDCGFPKWSPDAGRIAYTSTDGHHGDVIVVNADGSSPRRYPTAVDASSVAWSPTGVRVVVGASGAPTVAGLWTMDLGAGVPQRIRTGTSFAPAWSPDGAAILYSDGNQLFSISPDGTGVRQRSAGPGQHLAGAWSPDGRSIAFDWFPGQAGAHEQVWIAAADGSGARALTDGSADSYEATF